MTQLKVGKSGVNAETATDPNDFIFHSDYNTFKIIDTDLYEPTVIHDLTADYTVEHGLEQIPFVLAFMNEDGESDVVMASNHTFKVTSIVQEIVNRVGWGSSQDMGFKLRNNSGEVNSVLHFLSRQNNSNKCAYLEINYNPPATLINKSSTYRVRSEQTPITKFSRYVITDPEDTPVPFTGIKIAKEPHNVMNTSNPDHLKFSSDFNTLKYYVNDTAQLHVVAGGFELYTFSGYITHNLGYYPMAMVYATDDDALTNYTPLGWFQAGSGAYRQYSFYVTTTRLYVVVDGYSESGVDYYVDFYYKIFKNKIIVE